MAAVSDPGSPSGNAGLSKKRAPVHVSTARLSQIAGLSKAGSSSLSLNVGLSKDLVRKCGVVEKTEASRFRHPRIFGRGKAFSVQCGPGFRQTRIFACPRGVCWPRVRASSATSKPAFRPPVWGLLTVDVTTAISKPASCPSTWGLLTVLVPVAISKPASRSASQQPCCAFAPCRPHDLATPCPTSLFRLLNIS